MGILSLFQRPKPEDAAQSIAEKIVHASLLYRRDLVHPDDKQSANAGVEIAYLLLHLLDREIFARFAASQRDAVFDPIAQNVIATYAKAVLPQETPSDLMFDAAKQMQDTLNSRQLTYAKCHSLFGEQFPGKGTMVFALCFFVRRALGLTNRPDVAEILAGKKAISELDLPDLPDVEAVLRGAAWISSILKSARMQEDAKYLRYRSPLQ